MTNILQSIERLVWGQKTPLWVGLSIIIGQWLWICCCWPPWIITVWIDPAKTGCSQSSSLNSVGKSRDCTALVIKLFVWISRAFISDVTTAAVDSNSWSWTDSSSFIVLNLKKLRSLHFSSSKPWDSVALQLTPSQWPGTWLGCLSEGRRKIFRFSGRAWGQLAHNKSQQWRGPSACQYKVYQGKVGHVGDDWWPTGHLPLTRVQPGLQVILY